MNWKAIVQYWYFENVSEDVPPLGEIVELSQDTEGFHISWQIAEPPGGYPTKAELEALESDALVWWEARQKEETADTSKWTDRERRFAEVLLKEINILRDAAGLPARTMAQLEAAMRAEP